MGMQPKDEVDGSRAAALSGSSIAVPTNAAPLLTGDGDLTRRYHTYAHGPREQTYNEW